VPAAKEPKPAKPAKEPKVRKEPEPPKPAKQPKAAKPPKAPKPPKVKAPRVKRERTIDPLGRFPGYIAAILTGALCGGLTVTLAWATGQACSAVRGVGTCGGYGVFALVADKRYMQSFWKPIAQTSPRSASLLAKCRYTAAGDRPARRATSRSEKSAVPSWTTIDRAMSSNAERVVEPSTVM